MKGFTQTTGLTTVGTVSVGVGGTTPASIKAPANTTISTVLSMSNATASVADAAPTALGQSIDIPAGSSITIDLADSVTCSHLRFGKFFTANTSDYANLKMQVQLISTVPDTERPGIIYDYDLVASANASGVAYGQFPLYTGPINSRTTAFVDNTGTHKNTCGVYALVQRSGSNQTTIPSYVTPSGLSNMVIGGSGTLRIGITRGCKVMVTGSGNPAQSVASDFKVHLFASGSGPSYNTPGSFNCEVTGYSLADGTLTFDATTTTMGSGFTFVVFAYNSSSVLQIKLAYTASDYTVAAAAPVLLLEASSYTSGTVWNDSSGNGNNCTINGQVFTSLGSGSYFTFNNNSMTGTIPASTFQNAHTISCWCYRTSVTSWAGLFSNNTGGTYSCSALQWNLSTNAMDVSNVGVSPTARFSVDLGQSHLNKWIYATVVYSGVTSGSAAALYVYQNGTLSSSSGTINWNFNSTSSYLVGASYNPQYFAGRIAHCAVYPVALTAADIDANYNSTKSSFGL
jgi:hypothetical protein